MKLRTPSFYKDFKCIAGACPDSCCQGWEVDADEKSLEYYKTLPQCEIKDRINSVLDKDEFGNTIFKPADKMRCPFLNSDNLCDMHIAIGGEHTPYTCRTFPRFINDYGSLREMGVAFSCPVASDMMFNLTEDFDFTDEVNDLPPTLNDIDAQVYFTLIKARKEAYSIVCDKSLKMNERLIKLLDYALSVQQKLDDYDDNDRSDNTSLFDVFKNHEVINPQWTELVSNGKMQAVPNEKWCENIAMYFLFRYFLTAVYDLDVLSKVKMAVIGVIVPVYFGAESWTIHLWSKETEHSDVNMQRYKKLLRTAKCLTYDELKKDLLL